MYIDVLYSLGSFSGYWNEATYKLPHFDTTNSKTIIIEKSNNNNNLHSGLVATIEHFDTSTEASAPVSAFIILNFQVFCFFR